MQTPRTVPSLIGLAVMFAIGATATARPADEDERKYHGVTPPYDGPAFIGGQWVGGGGGVAADFDAKNVTLKAMLPLNMFPGGGNAGNDCWGYVSASGREYAIMGVECGFGFVEVTDPVNPVVVGVIQGPCSSWHDVKVIGNYAYGVSEGGSGIQVIDLSGLDSGIVTLVKNKTQNGHSSTHNIAHNPDSGYLYLVGANISNGGLIAVSTSNPTEPTIVGTWGEMYVHDAQIVTYTEGPWAGKEIAFCAGGYDGGWNQTGLRIVDVTDKANMHTIGTATWPQAGYSHQCWLSEDRQFLYLNDELDEQNFGKTTTSHLIDVSDLTNPVQVKTFTTGKNSIDHNNYVRDGKIYQANYTTGLRIFDASDVQNPVQVAWFDTYPEGDGASFNGAWSNYPFLPSGTILISDIQRGLFIVKEEVGQLAFDFPQGLPSVLDPGVASTIVTNITEDEISLDPASVRLNVRVNGGAFDAIAMQADGQGGYTADIPPASCFDAVDFYVSAEATDGRVFSSPGGAPDEAYNAKVYTSLVVLVSDPLETDTGWIVGGQGDNANTGVWTRMDPQPTDAQPGDDHTANGTICWVTDGRGGGLGDYDVDGGKTTLRTPIYDLSGGADASIRYWRWYSNATGGSPNADVFRVDISNNAGNSWTSVEVVGPSGPETLGGWYQHEFKVSSLITPTGQMQLRFIAEDAGDGSIVEAAIDDFEVIVLECDENTCAPDLNNDDTLDLFDFLAYTNLFNAQDPLADWDNNGAFELFDFLGYVNAFNAGC